MIRRRAAIPTLLAVSALAGATAAAVPGEVPASAGFEADKATLVWTAAPGADAHHIYRGADPAAYDHACRVYRTASASAALDEIPSEGALFYYLVVGVNGDGEGPLGFDGSGAPIPNGTPCADGDGDLVADNLDNCPVAANPTQADQDENGVGDRCDPRTYDFEADAPGTHPADMARLGPVAQALTVKDVAGDRAISFDQAGIGAHERFERALLGMPLQDTTIWVDVVETPQFASLELWSEGAYGWNAGSGIILQFTADGRIKYYDRRGQQVPGVDGPVLPIGGRLRLKLEKGLGSTSVLRVDAHDGAGWVEGYASFPIADDHLYRGRGTVVADYFGGPRPIRRITIVPTMAPDPLTLRKDYAWSSDWKVFQRNPSGHATIPVRFDYRLSSAGVVQARVVSSTTGAPLAGHDWSDHEAALDAADGASGALDVAGVPAGGNYDVEVRLLRSSDGTVLGEAAIVEVGVGDLFVAGGQSNMSGYSGNLVGAEAPVDRVHLFGNDYRWKRASEPMDDGTDQVDLVSSESPLHSMMLRFGKEIAAATGLPVGVIPGPLGGTNLYSQWQRDASRHDNRGTLYGSLLHRVAAQNDPNPPVGFLWYQGESDVGRTDYRANLERLIAQYREDLAAPDLVFGIVQLATNLGANLENWLGLQEQQRRVVEGDPRALLATAVDLPRSDTIHLNVEGYKAVGVRMANEFREHVYGEPLDASARLVGAVVVGNGRQIQLEYDRDVIGGAAGLFRAREGGAVVGVRSVSTSGRFVTLALEARVHAGATISYGYSWDPAAAWLRDASGSAVACFKDVPVD